jgi:hypothetical protein
MNSHAVAPDTAVQDPGGILPIQHASLNASRARPPQSRLMQAVLAGAVSDYLAYFDRPNARTRAAHVSASAWMRPGRGAAWPFSFERICATLGLDSEAVRDGLARRAAEARRLGKRTRPVSPHGDVSPWRAATQAAA